MWSAGPICLVTRRWTCFNLFISCLFVFFFFFFVFVFCLFVLCVCWGGGGGGSTTNAKLVLKRTSVNKAGFDASEV